MLCTDCNRTVKPVVALDIDGTLGDYHGHFLHFAAAWLGGGGKDQGRNWALTYDGSVSLAQFMRIPPDLYRQVKLAFRQGGLKRMMPMFIGADRIADYLRRAGAEVWITTTRPYMRLDNVDPDTREWLQRNGIKYDGLIYDESKYLQLCSIVGYERVVGVLDDLGEQYDKAAELGLNPILRKTTYNGAVERPDSASNLATAERMLLDRVKGWYKANAH